MTRLLALFATLCLLAACTNPNDLDQAPVDLGDFRLGHNVAVAPNITKGPASREASAEEWIAAMQAAIDERFGRYEGDKLYHFGISIEGYVLAVPGVPVVASPKSALIIRVTLWDDAAQAKLNEEPEQVTIIESFSADTWIGSGLTQSKEKQMENLTRNAAKLIENWMVRQRAKQGWFGPEPMASPDPQTDSEAPVDPEATGTETGPTDETEDS
ncbi:hypothetical protein EI983_14020 [Roseovarius faecimaris]|uniref:DUF4410 domain-containing protein n=1 Tax=Roseovarius faecimaris TaxID=2494550 RepID=A0A6I6IQ69_9RHOB|nr:hypothetical protein [Roseovarius faecimaris]QGX99320.1 hypothetical protein EI983_14020 [Roseovarius faecimaris]